MNGSSRGAVVVGAVLAVLAVLVVALSLATTPPPPFDPTSTAPSGYAAIARLAEERGIVAPPTDDDFVLAVRSPARRNPCQPLRVGRNLWRIQFSIAVAGNGRSGNRGSAGHVDRIREYR